MEAQAIAPAMYEWNDATFHACVVVAGASITTNKDFNEAALTIDAAIVDFSLENQACWIDKD